MSEEVKVQSESTSPASPPLPQTAARPKPAASRQRLLWVVILILLLGLVAVGLVTGWLWQQSQALEQRLGQTGQLEQTVEDIRQEQQSLSSGIGQQLDGLETELNQQAEAQQETRQRVDQAARSLLQMGNRTRNDWLLAEAEYLLRIANQRLQMERDIKGALALLQGADRVLQESDDMGAYPVREELAREIQALQATGAVDRVGLYLRLEAVIDQIGKLSNASLINTDPLSNDAATPSDQSEPADTGANSGAGSISDALARAWDATRETLAEVIVIRRMDNPVPAPLSPEQSAVVNLNLRLMLEQAEMALLSADPVLYQHALEKAQQWLDQWYDDSARSVAAIDRALADLAGQEIKPDLPDISGSLNLLKARINGQSGNTAAGSDSANGNQTGNTPDQNGNASTSESQP